MLEIIFNEIVLCFEDVFIDLFGGVGILEFLLGLILYMVEGIVGEMVIEV